jgi:hypothetical protein
MRGLDPRIHQSSQESFEVMDCRVKPGNDGWANIPLTFFSRAVIIR